MQIKTDAGKVQVCLEGKLTIANAAEIRDLLVEALAGGDSITVDLTGVTDMDLSTLQLICSAHRTARSSAKDLFLTGTASGLLLKKRKEAGYIRHQGCMYNPTQSCLWVGEAE